MLEGVVYRSPLVYGAIMRVLYGRHHAARHRALAELVPARVSVLEVCCGPAPLYRATLRAKGVGYTGLELNAGFVRRLRASGVDAREWDVGAPDPLPEADVVLMQASLYHFLPDVSGVLDRMFAAARLRVVVSEPVRNLSRDGPAPVRGLAQLATRVGAAGTQRFDEHSLDAVFARYADRVERVFLIPGGRDKVYALRAR